MSLAKTKVEQAALGRGAVGALALGAFGVGRPPWARSRSGRS